ncbi:GNAT family N-acetyltransferase [Actinomycetospora sp. OC33-EN08]|uniref:GNAT family N-acetyltransferase n=1 Tax=Actinomycetospora aurantiaca TaxID=3129233 RepID=A0ABU8MRF8_9PSEU
MRQDVLARCEPGENSLCLRRAAADDVPALAALFGADPVSAARGDSGDGDLADYEVAFTAIDADPRHLLVVATEGDGGPVVGTLQLSFLPGLARRGAWRGQIEAVHVAASQRGRGVGAWMIGWAVDESRRRGCGLVQLTSAVERHDAHRFYERLGFTASHVGFKRAL